MAQRRIHDQYGPAQNERVKSAEAFEEDEYDDVWPPRLPSSARRYQDLPDVRTEAGRIPADVQILSSQKSFRGKSTVPPRRTAATQTDLPALQGNRRREVHTDEVGARHSEQLILPDPNQRQRIHWLVFVGMAMFTMLVGWVLLTMLANWWQVTQDDWHYGRPRTFQTDMVVGHNDSAINPSHFIAINQHSHIEIIEFPGADPSKAKIYVGPTLIGTNQDLAVVTLTFKDLNGDGKPDMIVNVQDSHFVYINDNGQFRPTRPGENVQP